MQPSHAAMSPAFTITEPIGISQKLRGLFVHYFVSAPTRALGNYAVRAATRHLQSLDDRTLKDIGIEPSEIPPFVSERLGDQRGAALLGPVWGSIGPFR